MFLWCFSSVPLWFFGVSLWRPPRKIGGNLWRLRIQRTLGLCCRVVHLCKRCDVYICERDRLLEVKGLAQRCFPPRSAIHGQMMQCDRHLSEIGVRSCFRHSSVGFDVFSSRTRMSRPDCGVMHACTHACLNSSMRSPMLVVIFLYF